MYQAKECALSLSCQTMKQSFESLGYPVVFDVLKHPLQGCYSVHLYVDGMKGVIYTNGKGNCLEACEASAMGEMIERLSTHNAFADFYLPDLPWYPDVEWYDVDGQYLNEKLKKLYDPQDEWLLEDLLDFASDEEEKIASIPFYDMKAKTSVSFPVSVLSNLYASNGMAAGNTQTEAYVQALSEILERYVKFEVLRKGYRLPQYDHETIQAVEGLEKDIASLQSQGFYVEVLDASLGGRFPVTAIALIDPREGTLFVSYGAHPRQDVALSRTMTELMQGRDITDLKGFETPTFYHELVTEGQNLEAHFIDSNGKMGWDFMAEDASFSLSAWGYDGEGRESELEYLLAIMEREGYDVYCRDYDHLGLNCCHILVPGLSEVYPCDDMIYQNKNRGKFLRPMVLSSQDYTPEEIFDAISHLPDSSDVGRIIGVIFEEPFCIGELKAQLLWALGEKEDAMTLLGRITTPMAKLVNELVVMRERGYAITRYRQGLEKLFTPQRVERALAFLEGDGSYVSTAYATEYLRVRQLFERVNACYDLRSES